MDTFARNIFKLPKSSKPAEEMLILRADGGELELVNSTFPKKLIENWKFSQNDWIKGILELLGQYFNLRNNEAIGYYLFSNQLLVHALEDCYKNIKNYFSEDELVLELIHDPMDNDEKLLICILTELSPKNGIETLRIFFKEWWIYYPSEARNYIIIDVECT